jgi:hypothetical protein
VTLLQLGGSQERLAALVRGGIDAAPVDFAFEPKMKQMGFHLVPGKKTPFMNGPIVVTVASLKANQMGALRQSLYGSHPLYDSQQGRVDTGAP